MNNLTDIASSVNNFLNDIRAEVIVADLIENGMNPSDFIALHDGSFRRRFSRDVSHAEILKLDNGQQVLGLHLTRDSLYDSLPEAIFHDQSTEPLSSGHDMARLSKQQKSEEKEARLFFIPFENELFYQRVLLESEEREILHRFNENLFNDIFPQFWNLDRNLPKKLVSRFVLILHFAHRIVGNPEMTAKCLEVILDEEVKITINRHRNEQKKDYKKPSASPSKKSVTLGEDFICGEYISDSDPVMEFIIGPLKNSTVEDYLANGPYSRFLSCFYSFFVPVELDFITSVKVTEGEQQFILSDKQANAILGYNTGL